MNDHNDDRYRCCVGSQFKTVYLPIAVMLVVDHDMMIVVTGSRMVLYSMFCDSHHLHSMQHSIVVLTNYLLKKKIEREAKLD